MEEYRKRAQQKYLEQKKIKIEEDETIKKQEQEKIEKIEKIKQEQIKKQFYIQEQKLIINDAIDSYKLDKNDDNIMMILTIINGCIENIQLTWSEEDKKSITNDVIKFSNEVDANNDKRPKGLHTIANVKILKDSFEQIFKLLNLNVEIQTLDTDNDEEIARKLQETLSIPPFAINQVPNDILLDDDNHKDDEEENIHNANDIDDDSEDDENYARRLQNELNKPKVPEKKVDVPILSNKYNGLNCDDFINALLKDKVTFK